MSAFEPFQPKTDDPAEYWLWLRRACEVSHKELPHGSSPQKIYWDHPDDEWKNRAQEKEEELELSKKTRKFLRQWLTQTSPVRLPSSAVLHCVRRRLEFGQRQAKLFATTCETRGRCPIAIPEGSHVDNLMWLLDDVYCAYRFSD
jgi:hypothetical protein